LCDGAQDISFFVRVLVIIAVAAFRFVALFALWADHDQFHSAAAAQVFGGGSAIGSAGRVVLVEDDDQ